MNAEVRPIKTAAESALSAHFAAAKCALPGAGAIAALRQEAFGRFEQAGLPSRRVEEWKYTDLRALMRDALPLAPPSDATAEVRAAGAGGADLGGGVGRRRERQRIAHQRAQVGVLPFLDAPARQARLLEASESLLAQRRNRARPRQRTFRRREVCRERALGRGLDRANFSVHVRAFKSKSSSPSLQVQVFKSKSSSPSLQAPLMRHSPGIARSLAPRAPARSPCRRCARCGRAPAHAPHPGRCN